MRRKLLVLTSLACISLPMAAVAAVAAVAEDASIEPYYAWTAKGKAIQAPLGGLKGDPARGRKLCIDGAKGNCLACHQLPIPEEEFHGELGPSLVKVGKKFDEGKMRLRIVNIQEVLSDSLMPPMYKNPAELTHVAKKFQGRTVLTAQEVEDVVAYLMTLK
jgi:sulfur-oxidizing protein SoxX